MAVNDTYDVGAAFKAIEDRLIDSMMRNFEKHKEWETAEGFDWTAWQAEQLRSMEDYRLANQKMFGPEFQEINERIPELIEWARKQGNANEEINLLKNLGAKRKPPGAGQVGFFGVNDRKINALIKATKADFERGEYAVLRKANDEYKKIIFNAQVYANSGAGTYEQAVDMATKDFLSRGIQSIRYSNGTTHKMSDYADMAIKTAAKRAYLVGEGEMRDEWGEHLVVINPRVDACPDCMEFQGRVFIDDVYSGGSAKDGNYPMLSEAIAGGLYHPRCRDIHSTYYDGISSPPEAPTKEEIVEAEENETLENKMAVAARNMEIYRRLAEHSLDPSNIEKYTAMKDEWSGKYRKLYKQKEEMRKPAAYTRKQYENYKRVLGAEIPDTIESFVDIKYSNERAYNTLKTRYRVINMYKIDFGHVDNDTIMMLDKNLLKEKRLNFTKGRNKRGNIGGAYIDGKNKMYVAHSQVQSLQDNSKGYTGEQIFVGLMEKEKRHFDYIPVYNKEGDLFDKTFLDTEAKLFEHFHKMIESGETIKVINMVSEKGMCESCKGVAKQFMNEHPNVIVNVISNKRNHGDVWPGRGKKYDEIRKNRNQQSAGKRKKK